MYKLKVIDLKAGEETITREEYAEERGTDRLIFVPFEVIEPPTMDELEEWISDGVAEATDGCRVEPDGYCQHGKPSWLLEMGLI